LGLAVFLLEVPASFLGLGTGDFLVEEAEEEEEEEEADALASPAEAPPLARASRAALSEAGRASKTTLRTFVISTTFPAK
jgi:hypothetical protein